MDSRKRKYIITCLDRYWPNHGDIVEKFLKIRHDLPKRVNFPARGELILLPEWANDISVDGCLLVPDWAAEQAQANWNKVDWLAVCFWYLNNLVERSYERQHGPLHSYSMKLKNWDERFWRNAWANRIALFIRRWIAHDFNQNEVEIFGSVPEAQIYLTHDVDAINKTLAIRCKQSIFHGINAIRYLCQRKLYLSALKAKKAINFLFSHYDYWCFEKILRLEEEYEVKSVFNFYAGKVGNEKNLKEKLLDPAYDINDVILADQIRKMLANGWEIGLHQSYNTWKDLPRMREEKENLEKIVDRPITSCRQHWLRFSFYSTWKVQQEVGIKRDATLGFNDRPGFRNSAAIVFHPWSQEVDGPMQIESIPLVLMDSHLYDYQYYNDESRKDQIDYWLKEIKFVGGQASIVWHQRVMSKDYGWEKGYEHLLSIVRE